MLRKIILTILFLFFSLFFWMIGMIIVDAGSGYGAGGGEAIPSAYIQDLIISPDATVYIQ